MRRPLDELGAAHLDRGCAASRRTSRGIELLELRRWRWNSTRGRLADRDVWSYLQGDNPALSPALGTRLHLDRDVHTTQPWQPGMREEERAFWAEARMPVALRLIRRLPALTQLHRPHSPLISCVTGSLTVRGEASTVRPGYAARIEPRTARPPFAFDTSGRTDTACGVRWLRMERSWLA